MHNTNGKNHAGFYVSHLLYRKCRVQSCPMCTSWVAAGSTVLEVVKLPPVLLQEMQKSGLPNVHDMDGKVQLELLRGITGAFRPGILTCLMGVSGAGKTTLMDVLSGRKTGKTVARPLPSALDVRSPSPQRLRKLCLWRSEYQSDKLGNLGLDSMCGNCRRHHSGRYSHEWPSQGASHLRSCQRVC